MEEERVTAEEAIEAGKKMVGGILLAVIVLLLGLAILGAVIGSVAP